MGEALGSSFMDLAFAACFEGQKVRIQIIVEHKSSPDSGVYLQVAHYATGLWVRNHREGRSPFQSFPSSSTMAPGPGPFPPVSRRWSELPDS